MQSQRTWGELCQVFIEACMPDKGFLPVALYMTMNTCGAGKIKEIAQNHRGTTTRKIIIGGADQAMPKSRNWATFLSDGDNKTANPVFCWLLQGREFSKKVKNTHYNYLW